MRWDKENFYLKSQGEQITLQTYVNETFELASKYLGIRERVFNNLASFNTQMNILFIDS